MKIYFGSHRNLKKIESNLIVTTNLAIALISSIKFKHLPILFIVYGSYIIIIEYIKNSFKLLETSGYVYKFDVNINEISHNDYIYDELTEYTLHNDVDIYKKYLIKNVHNKLKQLSNTKFIDYETFQNILKNYVPNEEYKHDKNENKYVYHGSPINIQDEYLKPQLDSSDDKQYLYVNEYRSASLRFCCKGKANMIRWNVKNGFTWLIETTYNLMNEFNTSGYLYYCNKNNEFKSEYFPSMITNKPQKIIKKEHIKDVYEEMRKQKDIIIINYYNIGKILLKDKKIDTISFPINEIPNIKEDVKRQGYIITHRTFTDYGKYKLGEIYYNDNLGLMQVMSITELININYSPFIKYLTEQMIEEHMKYNEKYGLQLIMLKSFDFETINFEYKQNQNNLKIISTGFDIKYELGKQQNNIKLIGICKTIDIKITPYYHSKLLEHSMISYNTPQQLLIFMKK